MVSTALHIVTCTSPSSYGFSTYTRHYVTWLLWFPFLYSLLRHLVAMVSDDYVDGCPDISITRTESIPALVPQLVEVVNPYPITIVRRISTPSRPIPIKGWHVLFFL